MPTLIVVAGPNGCGKSLFTNTTWFSGIEVVDPDAIAHYEKAGDRARAAREALRRRRAAVAGGRSLLVETTLAGYGIFRLIDTARAAGYLIALHYMSVNSANQAVMRIRSRVEAGGHDVPEADVRRRFARSHANLPIAIARSDVVALYDNTDDIIPHREVALLRPGEIWAAESLPDWVAAAIARTAALDL